MVVHAKIEDFMQMLMKELNMEIPKFTRRIFLNAKIEESKTGKEILKVAGITEDGSPYEIFKSIKIDGKVAKMHHLTEQQIIDKTTKFNLNLQFHGHYEEPALEVQIPRQLIKSNENQVRILMIFDPNRKKWEQVTALSTHKVPLGPVTYK